MAAQLRCITVDITGTLMRYVGHIGDYYCLAAKRAGEPCPDYDRVLKGFKVGYEQISRQYPCFGMHAGMSNKEWWRLVVQRSFEEAGYFYSKPTGDAIFERIYSIFGSKAPYEVFDDVGPFLRWARARGLRTGSLSNAAARYRDQIMPALGITEGSELDFQVYSGLVGIEKPDPRIFEIARQAAGCPDPSSMLHIGDSFRKDYQAAENVGWNALLIDRFSSPDAKMCMAANGHVVGNLDEARKWIHKRGLLGVPT